MDCNCSRLDDWHYYGSGGNPEDLSRKTNQHTLVLSPFCPVAVAEMCGSAHPEISL